MEGPHKNRRTRMCVCVSAEWINVYAVSRVCLCVFLSVYLLPVCLSVCFYIHLSVYLSAGLLFSHTVYLLFVSLSVLVFLFLSLSIHLCVYLAYGPDPACSPRFMKCEQLSRWCISYSGRLCVGFVPQTKAYDTCEPLVAQTHRHRGSSGC